MTQDSVRAPSGQALAVPVEPASSLAASRFDPSRDDYEIAAIRDAWKLLACLDGRSRIRAAAYLIQLAVELPERDSDRSGEAGETQSGSTEGESAGRNSGIAQPSSGDA